MKAFYREDVYPKGCGTFSKHWKDDENLLFIQVPLAPSNFWTTGLRIYLQWLLILSHISPQPNFLWHCTWFHQKYESIPTYAPLTYCPSAPEFYLHLQSGSSALSHHSFPCRSIQNQKISFTRSTFQAICLQKDTEFSFTVDDWHVKGGPEKRVYAEHLFSAPNALRASPPSIIYSCCRTALKSNFFPFWVRIYSFRLISCGKNPRDN